MPVHRPPASSKSVRQSVTIPPALAVQVRRIAEAEATHQLQTSHDRFLAETDPGGKNAAGEDLIRAIFGKNALAEDPVL